MFAAIRKKNCNFYFLSGKSPCPVINIGTTVREDDITERECIAHIVGGMVMKWIIVGISNKGHQGQHVRRMIHHQGIPETHYPGRRFPQATKLRARMNTSRRCCMPIAIMWPPQKTKRPTNVKIKSGNAKKKRFQARSKERMWNYIFMVVGRITCAFWMGTILRLHQPQVLFLQCVDAFSKITFLSIFAHCPLYLLPFSKPSIFEARTFMFSWLSPFAIIGYVSAPGIFRRDFTLSPTSHLPHLEFLSCVRERRG